MIKIPDEAAIPAAKASHDQWRHECAVADEEPVSNWREWDDLELAEQLGWIEQARAAITAALAAWPNAKTLRDDGRRQTYIVPALVPPLPQEARDV